MANERYSRACSPLKHDGRASPVSPKLDTTIKLGDECGPSFDLQSIMSMSSLNEELPNELMR